MVCLFPAFSHAHLPFAQLNLLIIMYLSACQFYLPNYKKTIVKNKEIFYYPVVFLKFNLSKVYTGCFRSLVLAIFSKKM